MFSARNRFPVPGRLAVQAPLVAVGATTAVVAVAGTAVVATALVGVDCGVEVSAGPVVAVALAVGVAVATAAVVATALVAVAVGAVVGVADAAAVAVAVAARAVVGVGLAVGAAVVAMAAVAESLVAVAWGVDVAAVFLPEPQPASAVRANANTSTVIHTLLAVCLFDIPLPPQNQQNGYRSFRETPLSKSKRPVRTQAFSPPFVADSLRQCRIRTQQARSLLPEPLRAHRQQLIRVTGRCVWPHPGSCWLHLGGTRCHPSARSDPTPPPSCRYGSPP